MFLIYQAILRSLPRSCYGAHSYKVKGKGVSLEYLDVVLGCNMSFRVADRAVLSSGLLFFNFPISISLSFIQQIKYIIDKHI